MRPLRLLEIGLRLGDSLVAAGAVSLASGLLLASLGIPSALLLLEIRRGFAGGLVVDLGRALRRLGLTPLAWAPNKPATVWTVSSPSGRSTHALDRFLRRSRFAGADQRHTAASAATKSQRMSIAALAGQKTYTFER
ncbi:hypothetical protein ACVIWV_008896 [Bradyrhizobium diazoefficiens]|uniref:Uncharacterized protein n=1 Tax=Bradyrhizobium diazoefficiens TaxID=1355477 RepID=A0A0E4FYV0_9BRAD|nr:hypothetical protein [Bradyrhizobium diazoefficiens]MBR0866075.1 hypothetical protein [Bradyrhizobium diazoefficiens]MBR0890598.1 hypothetical protein [Bradyrhizobium diazoefficiens]MBR0922367.1 hypothetical protein [Bradyrhizobium diazoefficiens]BAR58134.1 hypothetical protein NK6_4975 [Bradyrhizobium diazoefficiens]